MIPDRTKRYLLDDGFVEQKPVVKTKVVKKSPSKVRTDKPNFLQKLDDGLWDEFKVKDWIDFFKHKANENGIRFIRGNYGKENKIIGALMKEFKPNEIKDMIEFVWDAPHTLVEKETMGLYILSGGWLNTIFQSAILWKQGKFRDKSAKLPPVSRPQREWRPEQEPIEVKPPAPTAEIQKPSKKPKIFI